MGAEIISVVNQKGGTGKTTTTMNLGSALAAAGKRVLLVDLDPQANLTYAMGLGQSSPTIAELISEQCSLTQVILSSHGTDLIPGSAEMADVDISLVGQPQREFFLAECLQPARELYDYILIDSPPSLSLLTVNALTAADAVIVPMQLEVLSLQGLSQIRNTVDQIRNAFNPRLHIKGILIVMYDRRRKLSQELQAFLAENLPDTRIFKSQIRLNVKVAEAPSFGMPVLQYDPASHGARDYVAFAQELIGIDEPDVSQQSGKRNKKKKHSVIE